MFPSLFRLASPFDPRLQVQICRLATKANATVLPRTVNEQLSISKMGQYFLLCCFVPQQNYQSKTKKKKQEKKHRNHDGPAKLHSLTLPAVATAQSGKKAFGTSPIPPANMASLKLQSAEMVNHNTKRLRFEFPDSEATSGLALTQATLALAFPNGGWIPAPRPYTPVSTPSKFFLCHCPNKLQIDCTGNQSGD